MQGRQNIEKVIPVLRLRGVTVLWLSEGGGEEDTMGGMAAVLLDQL